jgi:hypothetical protein
MFNIVVLMKLRSTRSIAAVLSVVLLATGSWGQSRHLRNPLAASNRLVHEAADSAAVPGKVLLAFQSSAVRIEVVHEKDGKVLDTVTYGTGYVVRNDTKTWVATALHVVASPRCPVPCRTNVFDPSVKYKVSDGQKYFYAEPLNYMADDDSAILEVQGSGFAKSAVTLSSENFEKGGGPYFAVRISPSGSMKVATFSDLMRYTNEYEVYNYRFQIYLRKLGLMKDLADFGYSGGCIFDKEGVCHGMVQSIFHDYPSFKNQWTAFIPSPYILDLMNGVKQ